MGTMAEDCSSVLFRSRINWFAARTCEAGFFGTSPEGVLRKSFLMFGVINQEMILY